MLGYWLIIIGTGLILLSPILHVLTRIAEGIEFMADVEAGPLADLSGAVDSAVALISKMAADLAAAGSPIDHSADIEALKVKLANAVSAASAPPPPAPAP